MLKIGTLQLKNKVVLAPMAGTSNPAYLKICEKMGVGYAITELISAEAIVRNNKKTLEMLNGINDLHIPLAVQLFGSNKDTITKAANILVKLYNVKIIDINMGCPVPKVVKSGAGSALLKAPEKIYELVKEVVDNTNIPITVKIRSGWDEQNINATTVAKKIEQAGASAISVHARTRSQGYSGKADWSIIKQVKEAVTIPVIGNGDIKTIYDAKKMLEETNCDAIMIGRATLGNPWFIKECVQYLENNKIIKKPTNQQKIKMIKTHYKLLKKYTSEKQALIEIRTHALWYTKKIPNIKEYKTKITSSKTEEELLKTINELEKITK
jgi:tRNA-dihydrouridine synthase B